MQILPVKNGNCEGGRGVAQLLSSTFVERAQKFLGTQLGTIADVAVGNLASTGSRHAGPNHGSLHQRAAQLAPLLRVRELSPARLGVVVLFVSYSGEPVQL